MIAQRNETRVIQNFNLGVAIELWLELCAAPCDGVNWQPLASDLRLERHDRFCKFRRRCEETR